jgi:hypothetical protein
MKTNNHHIDELFARELGNVEITPPENIWQTIEQRLDKKKRIGLLYYRMGLAAGIAILVSLSGIYYFNNTTDPTHTVATSQNAGHNNIPAMVQTATNDTAIALSNNKNTESPLRTVTKASSRVQRTESETETLINPSLPSNSKDSNADISIIAANSGSRTESETTNAYLLVYLTPKQGTLTYNKRNDEALYNLNIANEAHAKAETAPQYADIEKPKVNRWSIEGQIAPVYSYRAITSNSELNTQFNNNESGLVSYSNAIKISYAATNRFSVEFGMAYSVIGQTLKNIYIQQPASNLGAKYQTMSTNSNVNTSLGIISNDNGSFFADAPSSSLQYTLFNSVGSENIRDISVSTPVVTSKSDANIIQRMQMLEIPLLAKYYLLTGKFNWHFAGGVSANILIGNDATLKSNTSVEKIGRTDNLRPINFAGSIATGFGYAIKKNIIVLIEPTFKYYINSVSSSDIHVHPFSFGLYTGICYKL